MVELSWTCILGGGPFGHRLRAFFLQIRLSHIDMHRPIAEDDFFLVGTPACSESNRPSSRWKRFASCVQQKLLDAQFCQTSCPVPKGARASSFAFLSATDLQCTRLVSKVVQNKCATKCALIWMPSWSCAKCWVPRMQNFTPRAVPVHNLNSNRAHHFHPRSVQNLTLFSYKTLCVVVGPPNFVQ